MVYMWEITIINYKKQVIVKYFKSLFTIFTMVHEGRRYKIKVNNYVSTGKDLVEDGRV